jgi:hypothetical protein
LHGGTKHKYAIDRLAFPSIWLVQERTNLSQDEVKSLEEVGFVLNKQQYILPQNLFGGKSFVPIN